MVVVVIIYRFAVVLKLFDCRCCCCCCYVFVVVVVACCCGLGGVVVFVTVTCHRIVVVADASENRSVGPEDMGDDFDDDEMLGPPPDQEAINALKRVCLVSALLC